MANSVYNVNLSCNDLANTYTLVANKFTTGSIDSFNYDNFKISVYCSIDLTIKLRFHHLDNKTLTNDKTYNYTKNTYIFKSDVVEGEMVYLEWDTGGVALTATDFIRINIFFNHSSGHLITV